VLEAYEEGRGAELVWENAAGPTTGYAILRVHPGGRVTIINLIWSRDEGRSWIARECASLREAVSPGNEIVLDIDCGRPLPLGPDSDL
jgi:hypothetical protein